MFDPHTYDDVSCLKAVYDALLKRADQIREDNARAHMGRPFQDDLHQADRELTPVLGYVIAQFFASKDPPPLKEPDPYAPPVLLNESKRLSQDQGTDMYVREILQWLIDRVEGRIAKVLVRGTPYTLNEARMVASSDRHCDQYTRECILFLIRQIEDHDAEVEVVNVQAFYCQKRHQCRWQGLILHQGLGWGLIPGEHDPWRVWHDKECGGRLVELIIKPE